jgi:release factor glutamine methyltransferase
MKNSRTVYRYLFDRLTKYSSDEKESIVYMLIEKFFGLDRAEVISERSLTLSESQKQNLDEAIEQLNRSEPVQYVLGVADFFGRKFKVNSFVLIPRQETEEVVAWVIQKVRQLSDAPNILDIGTGSGCIGVTLAREISSSKIFASDVSLDALSVAEENARAHDVDISFMNHSILKQDLPFRMFDVIVSNPPYIAETESKMMDENVLGFEPHLALFVPDDDPLIFYKAIATRGFSALKNRGFVAVEINERFGEEVKNTFEHAGYTNVQIHKDIQKKDRFVTAEK